MIREGTAARNLEALAHLLNETYGARCLLCTDDKHPGDLIKKGHIDGIIREAIHMGAEPIAVIKAATFNAAQYFRMHDRALSRRDGWLILQWQTILKTSALRRSINGVF